MMLPLTECGDGDGGRANGEKSKCQWCSRCRRCDRVNLLFVTGRLHVKNSLSPAVLDFENRGGRLHFSNETDKRVFLGQAGRSRLAAVELDEDPERGFSRANRNPMQPTMK
jgi:hypothetical protein